jgi:hypothetical protein
MQRLQPFEGGLVIEAEVGGALRTETDADLHRGRDAVRLRRRRHEEMKRSDQQEGDQQGDRQHLNPPSHCQRSDPG